MVNFFKKLFSQDEAADDQGTASVTLKIEGMHCSSCSLAIDGALEDTKGVVSADTDYARSQTVIKYAPDEVSPEELATVIKNEGYEVK
jgi:P-type Cu+ transporter